MTETIAEFQESFDDVLDELCSVLYEEGIVTVESCVAQHSLGEIGVLEHEMDEIQGIILEQFGVHVDFSEAELTDTMGELAQLIYQARKEGKNYE